MLVLSVLLAAGCGSHLPSSGSHPASSAAVAVSCRQQYQDWKHGPAQVSASKLAAALKTVQAARKSGDVAGIRPAMKKLVPAALGLAEHPMPHCADPANLYSRLVTRTYTVGNTTRSAKRTAGLWRAAVLLKSLHEIEHQITVEVNRTVGQER